MLLHGAALAALVLETVGGHHIGPDGGQVFRRFNGGAHLRDRRIRTAHRTDTAVAPGLAADPVTDVSPIAPGMRRGRVVVHPGGVRPVTVAQVDQHHVVALGHKIVCDFAVAPLGLVIGRMQHDRREAALDKGAVLRGPVDVKCQAHAVAHGHHDILGEVDTVGRHELAWAIWIHMATVMPPSITITCPVMKAEASLARNTAAPIRSSGAPQRFMGVRLRIHSYCPGCSRNLVLMSVAM